MLDNESDYPSRIRESFQRRFNESLNDRVNRAAGLNYQKFLGPHHFAPASWECLRLFCDGYFLGTIMATQAVVEATVKFVADRNEEQSKGEFEDIVRNLKGKEILTPSTAEVVLKLWRHRNDFHHLNPSVSAMDLEAKAKECIDGLCKLEEELFGGDIIEGKLGPRQPKYYDALTDGLTRIYLRQFGV